MIGQHGTFDYQKYNRDFRDGFYGIEACLFRNEEDISNLIKESQKAPFQVGIHFPFRAGISKLRDALFLSNDDMIRLQAYDGIQQELEFITTALKPVYILFHYPKPVILDDRADWSRWRFDDRLEYEYESSYSYEDFKEKSDVLFEWLSVKGQEFNFVPVLEFDALNTYIYKEDYLQLLLEKHNSIKLCLDTARLHLQECTDPYFDALEIIKQYAKYAEVIHLSNVQITNTHIGQNHYPALPHLHPDDGWAPIEQYLRIIRQENKHTRILFEHRSDLISDEELSECYSWVDHIMNSLD